MAESDAGKRPDAWYCGAQRPNQPKGVTCTQRAGHGTDHAGSGRCSRHGGSTRNHKTAADKAAVVAAASKLDLTLTTDPVSTILEELDRTYRWVHFYEQLIWELPTHPGEDEFVPPEGEDAPGYWIRGEPGIYGRMYHVSGVPTGEAKPHVLVALYHDERKRSVQVAAEAIKANISERVMAMHEDLALEVAQTLKAFAMLAGLDPASEQVRTWGRKAMEETSRLRLLPGGQADAA